MPTIVVSDPPPADWLAFQARRRAAGADRRDEIWEGVLHMTPGPSLRHADVQAQLLEILRGAATARGLAAVGNFNLGVADDYRIPDAGIHRVIEDRLYAVTAALVVEILSPGDATVAKLPFYAGHDVDEVVIVDPAERRVRWLGRAGRDYAEVDHSSVVDLDAAALAARIDWPK